MFCPLALKRGVVSWRIARSGAHGVYCTYPDLPSAATVATLQTWSLVADSAHADAVRRKSGYWHAASGTRPRP